MRHKGCVLACFLIFALPVYATTDIQIMKQRLNDTVAKPEQVLAQKAEQIICKTDKKPVCYSEVVFIDSNYGLSLIKRPEDQKIYYVLFEFAQGKGWFPIFSRTIEHLSWPKWKAAKVHIPEPVASRLIQKAKTVR